MEFSDITVTVNMRLNADTKTAETCLKIVEAYVNANPVKVVQRQTETGETELNYEPA